MPLCRNTRLKLKKDFSSERVGNFYSIYKKDYNKNDLILINYVLESTFYVNTTINVLKYSLVLQTNKLYLLLLQWELQAPFQGGLLTSLPKISAHWPAWNWQKRKTSINVVFAINIANNFSVNCTLVRGTPYTIRSCRAFLKKNIIKR